MPPNVLYEVTVGSKNTEYSFFVVSDNAQEAYDKLKVYLDDSHLLHMDERKLKQIKLVATEKSKGIFD